MSTTDGSTASDAGADADSGIDSRYRAAADLLDGYVHESRFLRGDQSPDHRIVWASDGFEAIFGCTVEQYNTREIWGGFYHPEDAAAAVERAARLRRGETVESELRLVRETGEIRWVYVKNRPVFDPLTGQVIGVLGVGQDITRRKVAEQQHRKSEALLNSVTRSDPDWLLLLDGDLRVMFLNRQLPGAAPPLEVGDTLLGIVRPPERQCLLAALRDVLAGAPLAVLEVPVEWAGEAARFFEIRVAPVREEDTITGLAVRMVDSTDRRRIEDSLRTHSIILEKMREGVVLFDHAGDISYMNGASRRLFRLPHDQQAAGNVSRLGIPGFPAGELPAGPTEALCLRYDRTEFIARMDFARLDLHGRSMNVAVVQDYTEQKHLEREIIEIASREQQRIAIDLHDGLGQELTGAALMLRSLAGQASQSGAGGAGDLEALIVLINRAIQGVRNLARGLSPVELERGDLADALSALANSIGESHSVSVAFHSRPRRLPRIQPDVANHLYRIGQEAMVNAVKHGGPANLWVSLANRPQELVLTIEDDGTGFPNVDVETPGMGLRIMRYRARMIGATINVQRRAAGGTTVCCRWPRI